MKSNIIAWKLEVKRSRKRNKRSKDTTRESKEEERSENEVTVCLYNRQIGWREISHHKAVLVLWHC